MFVYVSRYHMFALLVSHVHTFTITCSPLLFTVNLSDDVVLLVHCKKLEVDLTQKRSSQLQSDSSRSRQWPTSFCQGLGLYPLSSGGL